MIKKLLKKLNSVSMKSGRFFADKSYKYDTIFFGAKFILELDDGSHQIDLNTKQSELVDKFVEAFTLDPNSTTATITLSALMLSMVNNGNPVNVILNYTKSGSVSELNVAQSVTFTVNS